ncbi:MAG TPA: histidine kinase N-terminal 7TM domain-containing protein [Methanomassiliicoccales archaeon]|jgi:signal transduction histidine kinase|nr:histidine kinase N-terminal 7TM domain-containing protein [Methanomassiliicoccales archaeon]
MDYYGAAIIVPNLLAAAFTAWVAYKVLTGKRTEHRTAMAICFAFVSLNSLVLLMEKMIGGMDLALPVVALEYVCESMILITLLIFVVQYIGLGRYVTKRNVLLIASPAIAAILFNVTNGYHHLFYEDVVIVQSHGFYMFEADYGPLFAFWMAYFFLVILATNVLLARVLMDTTSERRAGLSTLMLATITILITGLLYVFSPRDDPLVDILSIGFGLTALIVFFGERRSDFGSLEIIRFREAVGGMDDAVIILDSSLQVVYANRPGRKVLDQNSDYLWERMKARGLKVPAGSNKWETAMVIDDSSRHFILSTSDIFREGKPVGVVLVLHDISNRKALEEELRRANRSMSTLNQILRHDMRNDLTATWGYLELLEMTELNDRQKHLVGKLMERAKSANGHLEFASAQGAEGTKATAWQDVQSTIDKVLAKVDMKGIDVESHVQGIRLLADPLLENVFHTLADNTVRHGEHATRAVVRGENVEKGLAIIWEDDGIGVPSDRKELIFDKGYGDNTGLGLYLAREVLSTTGFTIAEEGEPGKGARFVIRAPSGWFTWKRPPSP